MKSHILVEKFIQSGYTPKLFGRSNNSCDITKIRFFELDQTSYDFSTLYLISTKDLPSLDTGKEFLFLCYGPEIDFHSYANATFTLLYLGSQISQATLFNLATEYLSEFQPIDTWMQLLVNALVSGKGLQHLVDTATRIFENPIYVVDLQNKYLAISSELLPENRLLLSESERGYVSEQGLSYIYDNRLDEQIRKSNAPRYCVNELTSTGMLVDAIHIQDIEVGHLMMLESNRPFQSHETDFFHRFSKLVSMELQKDSAYQRNKGVMYSYFLTDLIENTNGNIPAMKQRLSLLGYKLMDTFYILAIPPAGHITSNLQLEIILEQIKQILPGNLFVIYRDTIVFLITKEMYQNLTDYELSRLSSYLDANHLKAGISNFFQHLEDTSRFYRQAVDSVRLGVKLQDTSSIYYYSDYYVYKMLETLEMNDSNIEYLIHPGLKRLSLYDQEKGTEFIKTLQEYLFHPGQTSLIAEKLHIHKNTLLYRMSKIKSIIGTDLIEGADYMNMNLSLMIMKYLGML